MTKAKISIGKYGEDLAAAYLADAGYEIIERNWKCRLGELDIIAGLGKTLVFVEVKTKGGKDWGTPEEMVNLKKQRKLILLSQEYLRSHELTKTDFRIDVVAVDFDPVTGRPQINIIRSAIEG